MARDRTLRFVTGRGITRREWLRLGRLDRAHAHKEVVEPAAVAQRPADLRGRGPAGPADEPVSVLGGPRQRAGAGARGGRAGAVRRRPGPPLRPAGGWRREP